MKNLPEGIMFSKFWWLALLLVFACVNFLAAKFHYRFDLTKEKRYTLSKATKDLLRNLDADVSIDVFLKGDFPAGFRKLANSVDEFLQECKEYSKGKLSINIIDPFKAANDSAEIFIKETRQKISTDSLEILMDTTSTTLSQLRMYLLRNSSKEAEKEITEFIAFDFIDSITKIYGITPFVLQAPGKVGDEQTEKSILPGAVVYYKDKAIGIDLLKGTKTYGAEPEQLAALYNDVEATLEYKLASAIQKITTVKRPLIGYTLGHGEGWGYNVDDAVKTLNNEYQFDTVNVRMVPFIPSEFDALVILKPTQPFTDAEKLKLDQYVMQGGKLFCMIDNMYGEFDSLYQSGGFMAFDRGLNLEDIFFRYGARINNNLLQDIQCDKLPQVSGNPGETEQQRLVDWPFFPILNGTQHPISKNLDGVRAIFPNTIDTVRADGIKKTFLLRSSANARVLETPARVDFEFMQIAPDIRKFTIKDIGVAVLLEGTFKSLFDNRISKANADSLDAWQIPFKKICDKENKIIIVADGDIATNMYSQMNGPLPMGMNLFTRYTYANKEFYTNALEYLVNPSGILETRAKDFTLRLLNLKKVKEQKTTWQFINIALPVILIIFLGYIYQQLRKRKYAG